MAIYKLNSDSFYLLPETTFQSEKILERRDLQRLLRQQPEIVSPDTLIIAEEFGEWEDSRKRIDLLGLDITTSDNQRIVVSNQWSKRKIDIFREAAGKMGFSILEIL